MPFCTPAKMTAAVRSVKRTKYNSASSPPERKALNVPSAASSSALPPRYPNRYFITHPPITE